MLENHAVGVDEEGVIRFICPLGGGDGVMDVRVKEQVEGLGRRMEDCRIVQGGKGKGKGDGGSWWFPGFVGGLENFILFIRLYSLPFTSPMFLQKKKP